MNPLDPPAEVPKKRDTPNRILVSALTLFNAQGEANTSTNQIADETDISPGNLHYHFQSKSILVAEILRAFRQDIEPLLAVPNDDRTTIDDFWIFLHILLERLSTYRFVIRDFETLFSAFPEHEKQMRRFVVLLNGSITLYLLGLEQNGVLGTTARNRPAVVRILVIILLFSQRFDSITQVSDSGEKSTVRAAQSALYHLLPYLSDADAELVLNLVESYQ